MRNVIVHEVDDALARVQFLREIAGPGGNGGVGFLRFLKHPAQRNHVSLVFAQPPDRDRLRGQVTHINEPCDPAIEFPGELARIADQFEIGVLHEHLSNVSQDVLVEPVGADDGGHWVHQLNI